MTRIVAVGAICGLVLLAGLPYCQPAEQEARGSGVSMCGECPVQLALVATLRAPNPDEGFFPHVSVSEHSSGRYFVSPGSHSGEVLEYSPQGTLLRRIGLRREGAYEFELAERTAFLPHDTIAVFDGILRRMTILSPDLRFIRSRHIGVRVEDVVVIDSATMVVEARVPTPERFGLPLHTMTFNGRLAESFGSVDKTVTYHAESSKYRRITVATRSSVWAASLNRYRLEEWSIDGRLLRRIERSPEWFRPWDSPRWAVGGQERPKPEVRGIQATNDGKLWVVITVPRADWRPERRRLLDRGGEPMAHLPGMLWRQVDTIVELIDISSARVVGSARVTGALLGFAGAQRVFSHRVLTNGQEIIEIFELKLAEGNA